jgi:hypothetical protein
MEAPTILGFSLLIFKFGTTESIHYYPEAKRPEVCTIIFGGRI